MALITGTELSAYMRLEDSRDSGRFEACAAAACQIVAQWCGRTFDTTASASPTVRVFSADDQCYLATDDFWSTTGLVVKVDMGDDGTYETTWVLDTDFTLQPENGLLFGQTWPYHAVVPVRGKYLPIWNVHRPCVQITAAWGWASAPPAVKEAALLWGARIHKRSKSPEGIAGGFSDFGPLRVGRGDPDLHNFTGLLAPFRHPRVAAVFA